MKPCNESEIVGIKSMGHSKDYYAGYDAAEKNYIKILGEIRVEIMRPIIRDEYSQRQNDYCDGCVFVCKRIAGIIDKYITKEE